MHQNLSNGINHNIAQSEIEGGVFFAKLPNGTVLDIETHNRHYQMVKTGDGEGLLSGHPEYCPEPQKFYLHGSTWGGSMLKLGFIGRGMMMEGVFDTTPNRTFHTSTIKEITDITNGAEIVHPVQET